ncbi:hypothetical protein EB796_020607 [Bugula neritina]|uniref:Uncharacterized protein n=1 Tax=Bugula neritina TaxID=10212 RepID=A0A7J7J4Q8_BUGNE|nr:hypothetical protein EB796_020607 [Bugula neritina]
MLNVSLVTVPSSLTFIFEHNTFGYCYSANHRQDSELLLGTSDGVQLLSRYATRLSKYSTSEKVVNCVIETLQNVFILHRSGDISKVDMCLAGDITKRQQLFQFDRTGNFAPVMAVSYRYVVVNLPDTDQLIIFDLITKQKETIKPVVYLTGLHFLPDGHLLGVGRGALRKYKVGIGKLTPVWTCIHLPYGYSVCADSNGIIYVCADSIKTSYIISPMGEDMLRKYVCLNYTHTYITKATAKYKSLL